MSIKTRPTLLDLCCKAGGTSAGYQRAGFDVTGVDIEPQPHYPFTFHQADALRFLWAYGGDFDTIAVSPPCQGYSVTRSLPNRDMSHYPQLIEPIRDALQRTGKPYVIENVPGAPLANPITLCGQMFGLRVFRHRLFESNTPLHTPAHVKHTGQVAKYGTGHKAGQYGPGPGGMVTVAGHMFSRAQGSDAMQIDWMTREELAEAIPPAYTEYIGRQLINHHYPVILPTGTRKENQ